MDGIFAAMTARSYADEFFAAHSDRGNWTHDGLPVGACKLDIVVFEGIDPSLNTQDAIRYVYASYLSEQQPASVRETTFGRHQGYVATVASGLQGGATQQGPNPPWPP